MVENVPRILPENCGLRLRRVWDVPPVFPWLQKLGNVADAEMFRVFNMGIGMVLVVAEYYAEAIARYIRTELNLPAWVIGDIVPGRREVEWVENS